MVAVSSAHVEVDHVHDTVGLLEEVEGSLVLLSLDELVGAVIEFSQNDRDLVFTHAEFLVIMSIKRVVFAYIEASGGAATSSEVVSRYCAFAALFLAAAVATSDRFLLVLATFD